MNELDVVRMVMAVIKSVDIETFREAKKQSIAVYEEKMEVFDDSSQHLLSLRNEIETIGKLIDLKDTAL